ncbi:CACTA en-spm transposon protein [Cucumis melo var. makuwa]|uniref:CACTA en-spm transposon protein n=1 Tax=Cucumis melo var. makuwa TaxID=1194695 RepID=A0A5A7UAB5_CUCMM|nr:CACTA en-spm transposon protein [Cucumis melo var. makuwa]
MVLIRNLSQNKRILDLSKVDDVENEQLNVLEMVADHRVDEHIKNDTLCRPNVDTIVAERPIVRYVAVEFIDDGTMTSFSSGFEETDAMFLEFDEDLNIAGGSSSLDNNSENTQSSLTLIRHQQSQLLKLESYVYANGRIFMFIAPRAKKPIYPHVDVGREYIEVIKDDLQCFFVLGFNDQAMNRFVEHQIFTSFKEFIGDCHRHFIKYRNLKQARVNLPHILVGRMEDWHFLCITT